MQSRGLETITPAVWADAVTRATAFAHLLAHRLPRHLGIEDVVHTAVEHVLDGRRRLHGAGDSLAAVLCGTIKSILSPNGLAEFNPREPSATDEEIATMPASDPDEGNLYSDRDHARILELIRREAGGDTVFGGYLECFQAGFPIHETADRLGIPIAQCYEFNRKLKQLVRRVLLQLKPADLPR